MYGKNEEDACVPAIVHKIPVLNKTNVLQKKKGLKNPSYLVEIGKKTVQTEINKYQFISSRVILKQMKSHRNDYIISKLTC